MLTISMLDIALPNYLEGGDEKYWFRHGYWIWP